MTKSLCHCHDGVFRQELTQSYVNFPFSPKAQPRIYAY